MTASSVNPGTPGRIGTQLGQPGYAEAILSDLCPRAGDRQATTTIMNDVQFVERISSEVIDVVYQSPWGAWRNRSDRGRLRSGGVCASSGACWSTAVGVGTVPLGCDVG